MERYLLFDLDGTLTDPAEGILNSVTYALARFGIAVEDRAALLAYIGPPLRQSFQRFHGLTPEQAQQAVVYYREYFKPKGLYENRLYPGMKELLERLTGQGFRLAVATSKPEEFSTVVLEHFHILHYFDFVCGNTLEDKRPTKGAVIAAVRAHYPDLTPDNALMIGDREHDVLGARENGLSTLGVLYGYGSRAELEAAGAQYLAEDLPGVEAVIRAWFPQLAL